LPSRSDARTRDSRLRHGFHRGQSWPNSTRNAKCPRPRAEWLRRTARYVKIVAEAIHYAHERGILHRDLKPSNVLIDPFDQPRVTDFGLAKRLHHDSELPERPGARLAQLQPPEQAAAKRGLGWRRSDVYSLGAILYHSSRAARRSWAKRSLTRCRKC